MMNEMGRRTELEEIGLLLEEIDTLTAFYRRDDDPGQIYVDLSVSPPEVAVDGIRLEGEVRALVVDRLVARLRGH